MFHRARDEIDNTKCRREELISGGNGGGPADAAPPPPPPPLVTSQPPHPSLRAQNGYYTITRESVRTCLMRESCVVCTFLLAIRGRWLKSTKRYFLIYFLLLLLYITFPSMIMHFHMEYIYISM